MKINYVLFALNNPQFDEVSLEDMIERYGEGSREWLTGDEEIFVTDDPWYENQEDRNVPLVETSLTDLQDRYQLSIDMLKEA